VAVKDIPSVNRSEEAQLTKLAFSLAYHPTPNKSACISVSDCKSCTCDRSTCWVSTQHLPNTSAHAELTPACLEGRVGHLLGSYPTLVSDASERRIRAYDDSLSKGWVLGSWEGSDSHLATATTSIQLLFLASYCGTG
jgi:hypothetical protein